MLHGEKAAQNSAQAAKEAFSGNSLVNSPSLKIKSKDIDKNMSIIDLIILSKFESSKSEIRRLIKGNAIKLNDKVISDEKLIISDKLFQNNLLKTLHRKEKTY